MSELNTMLESPKSQDDCNKDAPVGAVVAKEKPKREKFIPTMADAIFAFYCLFLGILFVQWGVVFHGWGTTVFCWVFAAGVLVYSRAKKIKPTRASWYWLAIMLLAGSTYALWPAGSLGFYQFVLVFCSAVYWCACLFGGLLLGKTSNYLPMDGLIALFVVPLRNFLILPRSVRGGLGANKDSATAPTKRKVWGVLLGIVLCIVMLGVLVPTLQIADMGMFSAFTEDIYQYLIGIIPDDFIGFFVELIAGVLAGMFICGMVAGRAKKPYTASITHVRVSATQQSLRIFPHVTSLMLLGVASGLYAVFILCQIPHYFSAFAGMKPDGFLVYSEYARNGFFELCRVASINLALLTFVNCFSSVKRVDSRILRVLNLVLCGLTLLILCTAFSKMALYINMHGLTPKRVLTSVFMVFLAGVCIAVCVMQYRKFSIVRFAAVFGSALLYLLCLVNLDGQIVRYNADRYMSGDLPSFEVAIVRRGGVSGISAAIEVYEQEKDPEVRRELLEVIVSLQGRASLNDKYWNFDSLQNMIVRGIELPDVE